MPRIFIVDETPSILELYDDILSEEGYRVQLALDPILDLDQVAQFAPDLIILEYLFGHEAQGLVLVQRLWMAAATAHIPIIVCTAAVNLVKEVQPELDRHGIRVLAKPFAIDDLLAVVRHALATGPPVPTTTPQ
jgi:DNA-binding response OmpR family regulator